MDPEEIARNLDEAAMGVGALTNLKQQFITAGWEERNAERVVIAIISSQSK